MARLDAKQSWNLRYTIVCFSWRYSPEWFLAYVTVRLHFSLYTVPTPTHIPLLRPVSFLFAFHVVFYLMWQRFWYSLFSHKFHCSNHASRRDINFLMSFFWSISLISLLLSCSILLPFSHGHTLFSYFFSLKYSQCDLISSWHDPRFWSISYYTNLVRVLYSFVLTFLFRRVDFRSLTLHNKLPAILLISAATVLSQFRRLSQGILSKVYHTSILSSHLPNYNNDILMFFVPPSPFIPSPVFWLFSSNVWKISFRISKLRATNTVSLHYYEEVCLKHAIHNTHNISILVPPQNDHL